MGINSQGTAYDFGQLGSMLVTSTTAFYPPKGMVINCITSIDSATEFDNAGLISETDEHGNSPWVTTATAAHGTGVSAAQNAHNDAGGGAGTNPTGVITLAGADANIKVGMIVEQATMCPRSLTNPYVVKSISGTTLTVAKKQNRGATAATAANLASGAAAAIYFFENHGGQGFGGAQLDDTFTIASGISLYGRWTEGKLDAGKVIVYFGY
tara:strand:- start:28 stop:660 length:633 start_codon:yes stop_codon:yes gene_type:complete